MKCLEKCRKTKTPCQKRDCRLWVDYSPDLNCVSETVENHGALTLREVAKRLNVSFVRVKQIVLDGVLVFIKHKEKHK